MFHESLYPRIRTMNKDSILFGVVIILCFTAYPQIFSPSHVDIYPPDELGPFRVGYYKTSFIVPQYGEYWATVRYPATRDGFLAPLDAAEAPYPGVIVANGWAGAEWNIKWVPRHLSSFGYITLCFTPPNNTLGDTTQWAYGFSEGIETLKYHAAQRYRPIYNVLDTETFGAIGLSMGGAACIEAAGDEASDIDAAVCLAPAGHEKARLAAQNISVPIQFQVGSRDGMVPPDRVLPYYTNLTPHDITKEYLEINGGNHIGYTDIFFAYIAEWLNIDDEREIAFQEQHRISQKYFTAWFQFHLKYLEEYFTYLFGEEAQSDLNEGILSNLFFTIS